MTIDASKAINLAAKNMAIATAGTIERLTESSSPEMVEESAISSLGAIIINSIVQQLEIIKKTRESYGEGISVPAERLTNATNIELIALCMKKLTQASMFIQKQ